MFVDNTAKTPFAQYTHQQLWDMLHAGVESTARDAANNWDSVGARLHEQASNLDAKLGAFKHHWKGGAADQYQTMVSDLSGGLREIGDVAFRMRDLTNDAGDALVKAKAEMPPPVSVPDLPAATVQLATTPMQVSPFMAPNQVITMQQQQQDAVQALQQHQQAVAQADAAHAKAVQVMTELAGHYQAADAEIPRPATGGTAPDVPQNGTGTGQQLPSTLAPGEPNPTTGQPTGKPVFGNMFTAGLAAVTAAGAGRLGIPILPKVPPWAQKTKEKKDKAADDKAKAGLSGLGGGKGIGGGGTIGGGSPPPTPRAGLTGAAVPAAGAAAALRALGSAAGAGAGGTGMPMMPMMPYAPGGHDMAGARRIPPWLMETEEVWGQSSTITPPVVGEDPPAPAPDDYRF
ncbi:WXG100 family type VII secretion target [Labedaea rhizosphaerae]|uniref:Outer membrane channel protein CpnT-like N-terminal domain-containing protein n=1 Tax=Labedaea rhizosphaerae TaxID=598644 RepID=A0A4R6S5G1_LABRH|nr:WXG100 family type VII secretion target [Labedaea rhizosphaerae]TDP95049.1 hypothetical protein EV186_105281 [Labedaea rhizosphaerae]